MKFKIIYLMITLFVSFSFSKSLLPEDYVDGYVKFDINNSEQIVAVLPFSGLYGLSASDYSSLYLGKYTDLDIIERQELIKIMDEQDLLPERLNDVIRAKIKELFGADLIVLGKVWSKCHLSLVNIIMPWNWNELFFKHWYITIRIVNADTGEIVSNYYSRDGHGLISLGMNDSYLSEKIEEVILTMYNDFQDLDQASFIDDDKSIPLVE